MLGIAVVGAGNWGKNLVRNFASLKGAELRYVCDLDENLRGKMAVMYPQAQVVADLGVALADAAVDAVVVAVEAPLHYQIARTALEAGKHVYVEKPLTLKPEDAEALMKLAAEKGLKLMVGHLLEYHPAVNYMKELMRDGALGDALYLYCQRVNLGIVRRVENAWWSLAPHDISVACYLFGAEPVSVSATGQAYLQEGIEDVVFASLKFADGRMAHMHVSWLDPHKLRRITLVGSKKMVVFDDMEASEKIRLYDKAAEVRSGIVGYAEAITIRTGDILIPQVSGGEPLGAECRHFVDCIVNDTTPRSDGADGLRVVKALQAGSESLARNGEPAAL